MSVFGEREISLKALSVRFGRVEACHGSDGASRPTSIWSADWLQYTHDAKLASSLIRAWVEIVVCSVGQRIWSAAKWTRRPFFFCGTIGNIQSKQLNGYRND
jgi:hypothetical protein